LLFYSLAQQLKGSFLGRTGELQVPFQQEKVGLHALELRLVLVQQSLQAFLLLLNQLLMVNGVSGERVHKRRQQWQHTPSPAL